MPPVEIKIRVSDDGTLAIIDQTGQKLGDLGRQAEQTNQGGLASMFKGAMDMKAGFDIISRSLSEAGGLIDNVNKVGVESLRTKAGLDAMTGGQAIQWAEGLTTVTKGLVDDTELMKQSTFNLSAGIVKNQSQMEELARIGATLGLTFQGNAMGGIEGFSRALETVGQKRSIMSLGVDVQAVMERFNKLKETMSESDAWSAALFEVAGKQADKLSGVLDGTGTAADRLKIKWEDLKESVSERVSIGIEGILNIFDYMTNPGKYIPSPEKPRTPTVGEGTPTEWAQGRARMAQHAQSADVRQGFYAGQTADEASAIQNAIALRNRQAAAAEMADDAAARGAARGALMDAVASAKNVLGDLAGGIMGFVNNMKPLPQSLAEAFPVPGGGLATIGGEVAGGMGGAIAERRKMILQQQGKGAAERFDASAAAMMDSYALATGQATKESLLFRDVQEQLDSDFAKGKLSLKQYEQGLLSMAVAAAQGKTSLSGIYDVMWKSSDPKLKIQGAIGMGKEALGGLGAGLDQATGGIFGAMLGGMFGGGGSKGGTMEPIETMETLLGQKIPAAASNAKSNIKEFSDASVAYMQPVIKQANAVQGAVNGIKASLAPGNWTFNVSISGGGGSPTNATRAAGRGATEL